MPDYYEILGVPADASEDEIHAAYRERVKELHPDRRGGVDEQHAGGDIRDVNDAWRVLGNAQRRADYDRWRRAPSSPPDPPGAQHTPEPEPEPEPPPPLDIPVPPGFHLFPRPRPYIHHQDWRYRAADQRRGALSLAAMSPNLAALAFLADGDVWKLDLSDQPVADDELRHVARFPSLESLDLSYTRVTDRGLPRLAGLQLHELALAGCDVSDDGLAVAGRMPTLRALDLFETRVTDDGVASLSTHPRLDMLDIRRTRVRSGVLDALAGLASLRELRIPRVPRADRQRFQARRPDIVLFW